MGRLTYSNPDGTWGLANGDITKVPKEYYGAICKLKDYENSGLDPQQLEELDELYRAKCEELAAVQKRGIPIATIKINKEDLQKIVDEKMKDYETTIEYNVKAIRSKAIDELKNEVIMHFTDWKSSEDDKWIKDIIELASESVEEIAEQMKSEV